MNNISVTCLSGVSCGGKTTVLKELHGTTAPGNKQFLVMTSDVTRPLRSDNESFRRHISFEEHTERTANGEYIQSILYNQNYYSVRRSEVDTAIAAGKHVLVDCIPDGVRQFKENYPTKAIFIFSMPAELYERHLLRGTPPEEMRWRLKNAVAELKDAIDSGYYVFIHNVDLEKTKAKVVAFIDGENVASDPVDLMVFSHELRYILTNLEDATPLLKDQK